MRPHNEVQKRYEALHDGFSPLVTALILAALAAVQAGIEFDERGNVKPFDADKDEDGVKAAAMEQIAKANTEFADAVREMLTATAQFMTATQALPRSINEACAQVAAFQLDYEAAAREAQEKTEAWRVLDVQSGRTKVAVAKRLQEGGMARTAAEAAASGDPEYTTLKDKIGAALSEMQAAEIERDVCLSKLLTSRTLLQGQIQMSVARIGAPTVVIREDAVKASGAANSEEPPKDGAAGATSQAAQG